MNKIWQRVGDERVVKRHVGGETVLVPYHANIADMSKLYFLDEVSEFIWDLLEEPYDTAVLVEKVCAAYDIDKVTAQDDIARFVAELAAANLLDESVA